MGEWSSCFTVAMIVLASCAFDSGGVGGEASASVGSDDTTADVTDTSATSATTSATTAMPTDTGSSADTGLSCLPAHLRCECDDAGECLDGLFCVEGVCSAATCGDGIVQEGEECEPGVGKGKAAGCGDDCTFLRGAQSIALGSDHTCAVTAVGVVRCWGAGDRGKLGLGSAADVGHEPGEPASAPDVDTGDVVDRVALGTAFSCALRMGGDVVCWGYRANGRLGDGLDQSAEDIGDDRGEIAAELGPVSIPGLVVDFAVGGSHACALPDSGQVYCWGTGMGGRLGYANVMDVGVTNNPSSVGPVMLPEGFTPIQLAAGAGHTCALDDEGRVLCWGDAASGILGTMNPEDIGDTETPASGAIITLGGNAVAISAGSQHTCALLDDGIVRCWGVGDKGRLGYGNTDNVGDLNVPAEFTVMLPGAATQISAGRAHTCAVLEGGSALCWGEATTGQLGQGNTEDLGDNETLEDVSPILVDDDPNAVVVAIEAGGDHTCALLDGGRVRCWGAASVGQLGYGNGTKIGDDEPPDLAGDVVFAP